MQATIAPRDTAKVTFISTKSYEVLPDLIQTRDGLSVEFAQQLSTRLRSTGEVGLANLTPVLVFELTEAYTLPCGRILDVGTLVLADGHHRHYAVTHLPRGMSGQIRAEIRKGTMEDAILAGLATNRALVDRVLTVADMARAVKVMVRNEAFRIWPDHQIARQTGLSCQSVKNLRLKLRDDEGVAIPEKVMIFRDGTPTDRWIKYAERKRKGDGQQVYSRPKHGVEEFFTRVSGSVHYLGRDKEVAEARAREMSLAFHEEQSPVRSRAAFRLWCGRRLVRLEVIEEHPLGGMRLGGCVIHPLQTATAESFLATCCRLLFLRNSLPEIQRLVMVGFFATGEVVITKTLPLARQMGIEFMTPEEFIAEFGPKAESAEPDPPCASNDSRK